MVALLPIVLTACLGIPPVVLADQSGAGPRSPVQRSEALARGIARFDRAFYQLSPSRRDAEAVREFEAAIGEFEAELAANPHSIDAHHYLGRIFTLRKQFRKAAAHYDEVRRLDPADVDACVSAAAAWADAGEFGLARDRLIEARGRTDDPKALATIDRYLEKLERRSPTPLS